MVLLPESLQALKKVAKEVGLDLRGAYLNLDGGFDSAHNRKCIFNAGLIPNIPENPRNRKHHQARTEALVQCHDLCVAHACGADLCVGGQIQAVVVTF